MVELAFKTQVIWSKVLHEEKLWFQKWSVLVLTGHHFLVTQCLWLWVSDFHLFEMHFPPLYNWDKLIPSLRYCGNHLWEALSMVPGTLEIFNKWYESRFSSSLPPSKPWMIGATTPLLCTQQDGGLALSPTGFWEVALGSSSELRGFYSLRVAARTV